ncbi:hypothetical protein Gbro_4275 [Gordonia bronchialis DSM 43247]|uniref:Uncharacterized protein n=1 Tax=Gordonia bronchialis (strain ATCC 25592 / DSM 43247 / BCRC 13721 / JCM 3198 / KCTC 3076 / NBRC 16047 / NCTC 10667) TaxID=526226 RepID=D0L5G3_GORB4|nr:hypothetical protein [Gordonia bronchialis]ACY23421.1 hypothetical protein Gbro_4275 [Gordonia bronchialis DSM 43247]MCC3321592.1 hypothetical protein [Gordonia bronchialis]QGS23204.1 hypothetical protein FOB84_02420 [Gordonia bronchialis]STQ66416.1 Uncharacterised protein [Gordonia bronchialis]
MTMSKSIKNRILAGTAALGISAALAAGGAGLAHAGTVPARPGEPTVAMTLTNHTNHTEWLVSATPGTGQWVQAPTRALAPGASETIVSAAPGSSYETVFVTYRIGAVGPRATYNIENVRGNVNTNMTGTTGGHYFINSPHIATGYPNVNVSYDLW